MQTEKSTPTCSQGTPLQEQRQGGGAASQTLRQGTLFYIPSYFDFVALRNILLKHEIASSHFVSITEYSRGTEVTRGRARFLQGRKLDG